MVSIILRLVFAAATLTGGYLLLRSQRLTGELLSRATAEAPGRIVQRREAPDNISRRQAGRPPAYRYQFEFAVGGRSHQVSSYETTGDHAIGEPVRIRYIPAAFEGDGPVDTTWSAYAVEFPPPDLPRLRPVVGWIFIGIGVVFILTVFASIGVSLYFRAHPNG